MKTNQHAKNTFTKVKEPPQSTRLAIVFWKGVPICDL